MYLRCNADKLGLVGAELLAEQDIHLHFPAGAVEKDGPSAGRIIFYFCANFLNQIQSVPRNMTVARRL